MPATVQISRYPNRRLYDRDRSKYVSLDDIEAMVRAGKNVEIRDSQTGEDLTKAVLVRIIVERNPEKMDMFPTAMLHFMLRSNEVMTDFLRDYFRHGLTYLEHLQHHPTATPMHWVRAWLDGLRTVPGGENGGSDTDRAAELSQRVQQLEERLRQLEQG